MKYNPKEKQKNKTKVKGKEIKFDLAKKGDSINPEHYKGDIECIDAIKASMSEDVYAGYLKGSALKYLWRYEKKENPKQDLQKAEWFIKKLIEL